MIRFDLQLFNEEKTEKATPKKKSDARKEGNISQSKEINSAFLLLSAFVILAFFGSFMGRNARYFTSQFYIAFLDSNAWLTVRNINYFLRLSIYYLLIMLLPLFLTSMIVGFSSSYMQVGSLFTTKTLKPKLSKLNPIEGFKKLFSLKSVVELVKSLIKILLIGYVVFSYTSNNIGRIIETITLDTQSILAVITNVTLNIGIRASIILLFIAVIDHYYQKYDYEKNLKMSKHEVKEERKQMDGNPQIKSKIREKQRQMSMQRMMQDVPEADVVITNPTHFAVAIRFKENSDEAPLLIAKGQDILAKRIRKIANENEIIIVENKALARVIYKTVEIGAYIPPNLYKAVAEVLAYVYKIKGKG